MYDINETKVIYTFKYHKQPVVGIVYNVNQDYVVSLDKSGAFQYWTAQDGTIPKDRLQFKFQITTDLYTFKKKQLTPLSLSISPTGQHMGVFASDWQVRRTACSHPLVIRVQRSDGQT